MKKLIAATLSLAMLAGCATTPMDQSKPVHYTQGFFETGYQQDGHFVDYGEAQSQIATVPEAAQKLRAANYWMWGGFAVDLAGVIVALSAPTDDYGYKTNNQYWIGLGIILFGSLPFHLIANNKRTEAAETYNNETFTTTRKSGPRTSFYMAPVKDGATAGLALSF